MASLQHPVDARSADPEAPWRSRWREGHGERYEDWSLTNEYNASPLRDRVYASGTYSADLGEILGLALDLRFSVLRDWRR